MAKKTDKEALNGFLESLAKAIAGAIGGDQVSEDEAEPTPSASDVTLSTQKYLVVATKRLTASGRMYESLEIKIPSKNPEPDRDTVIRHFVRVTEGLLDEAIERKGG